MGPLSSVTAAARATERLAARQRVAELLAPHRGVRDIRKILLTRDDPTTTRETLQTLLDAKTFGHRLTLEHIDELAPFLDATIADRQLLERAASLFEVAIDPHQTRLAGKPLALIERDARGLSPRGPLGFLGDRSAKWTDTKHLLDPKKVHLLAGLRDEFIPTIFSPAILERYVASGATRQQKQQALHFITRSAEIHKARAPAEFAEAAKAFTPELVRAIELDVNDLDLAVLRRAGEAFGLPLEQMPNGNSTVKAIVSRRVVPDPDHWPLEDFASSRIPSPYSKPLQPGQIVELKARPSSTGGSGRSGGWVGFIGGFFGGGFGGGFR